MSLQWLVQFQNPYRIRLSFFRKPFQSASGSELQNPVGSRSGNRIVFNTGLYHSDSVIRLIDLTRVTIFGCSDSTRVTLRKIVTRFKSRFSQNDLTRVRIIFTKSLSSWWTNPVPLHTKKWALFAWVMIKMGENFLFWLSSRAVLHFKDQVSPTCKEVDLRLCFHWGAAGHNSLIFYRGLM